MFIVDARTRTRGTGSYFLEFVTPILVLIFAFHMYATAVLPDLYAEKVNPVGDGHEAPITPEPRPHVTWYVFTTPERDLFNKLNEERFTIVDKMAHDILNTRDDREGSIERFDRFKTEMLRFIFDVRTNDLATSRRVKISVDRVLRSTYMHVFKKPNPDYNYLQHKYASNHTQYYDA
jgi:hypothetical protein